MSGPGPTSPIAATGSAILNVVVNALDGTHVVNLIGHFVDFFRYKHSGKNQGPYGSSPHAENSDPLIIPSTKPYVPIDRNSWEYKGARQPRIPGSSPYR